MEEKSNQIHYEKKIRKILFAMTKVVFEIIALGFQSVIVLVLNLPARLKLTWRDS